MTILTKVAADPGEETYKVNSGLHHLSLGATGSCAAGEMPDSAQIVSRNTQGRQPASIVKQHIGCLTILAECVTILSFYRAVQPIESREVVETSLISTRGGVDHADGT